MRHRFRLIDAVDSRDIGWFVSNREDWKAGDHIGSADRPQRVVLAVIASEDDADYRANLVVVSVGEAAATEAAASA
jgi:hypothetical protein